MDNIKTLVQNVLKIQFDSKGVAVSNNVFFVVGKDADKPSIMVFSTVWNNVYGKIVPAQFNGKKVTNGMNEEGIRSIANRVSKAGAYGKVVQDLLVENHLGFHGRLFITPTGSITHAKCKKDIVTGSKTIKEGTVVKVFITDNPKGVVIKEELKPVDNKIPSLKKGKKAEKPSSPSGKEKTYIQVSIEDLETSKLTYDVTKEIADTHFSAWNDAVDLEIGRVNQTIATVEKNITRNKISTEEQNLRILIKKSVVNYLDSIKKEEEK